MCPRIASFNVLVSTYIIATASTRTANLVDCNFHTIRYLLLIFTHASWRTIDTAEHIEEGMEGWKGGMMEWWKGGRKVSRKLNLIEWNEG